MLILTQLKDAHKRMIQYYFASSKPTKGSQNPVSQCYGDTGSLSHLLQGRNGNWYCFGEPLAPKYMFTLTLQVCFQKIHPKLTITQVGQDLYTDTHFRIVCNSENNQHGFLEFWLNMKYQVVIKNVYQKKVIDLNLQKCAQHVEGEIAIHRTESMIPIL